MYQQQLLRIAGEDNLGFTLAIKYDHLAGQKLFREVHAGRLRPCDVGVRISQVEKVCVDEARDTLNRLEEEKKERTKAP